MFDLKKWKDQGGELFLIKTELVEIMEEKQAYIKIVWLLGGGSFSQDVVDGTIATAFFLQDTQPPKRERIWRIKAVTEMRPKVLQFPRQLRVSFSYRHKLRSVSVSVTTQFSH